MSALREAYVIVACAAVALGLALIVDTMVSRW